MSSYGLCYVTMNHIYHLLFFFSRGCYHELLDHSLMFADKEFTRCSQVISLLFFPHIVLLISLKLLGQEFLGGKKKEFHLQICFEQ